MRIIRLFRAVSQAELEDIETFGGFRPEPAGFSYHFAKLFATSEQDAAGFGRHNYRLSQVAFAIVAVTVPSSFEARLERGSMDGVATCSISVDDLPAFNRVAEIHVPTWIPHGDNNG